MEVMPVPGNSGLVHFVRTKCKSTNKRELSSVKRTGCSGVKRFSTHKDSSESRVLDVAGDSALDDPMRVSRPKQSP